MSVCANAKENIVHNFKLQSLSLFNNHIDEHDRQKGDTELL